MSAYDLQFVHLHRLSAVAFGTHCSHKLTLSLFAFSMFYITSFSINNYFIIWIEPLIYRIQFEQMISLMISKKNVYYLSSSDDSFRFDQWLEHKQNNFELRTSYTSNMLSTKILLSFPITCRLYRQIHIESDS